MFRPGHTVRVAFAGTGGFLFARDYVQLRPRRNPVRAGPAQPGFR